MNHYTIWYLGYNINYSYAITPNYGSQCCDTVSELQYIGKNIFEDKEIIIPMLVLTTMGFL